MIMCEAPNCDGQFHHMVVTRDAKSLAILRSMPMLLDLTPEEELELLTAEIGQKVAEELERCPDLRPASEPEQKPVVPQEDTDQNGPWWSNR